MGDAANRERHRYVYAASLAAAWLVAIAALWCGIETFRAGAGTLAVSFGVAAMWATVPMAILATVCLHRTGRAGGLSKSLVSHLFIIAALSFVLLIERHLILFVDEMRVDRAEDWMPGWDDVLRVLMLDLFVAALFWAILSVVVTLTHLEWRYRND